MLEAMTVEGASSSSHTHRNSPIDITNKSTTNLSTSLLNLSSTTAAGAGSTSNCCANHTKLQNLKQKKNELEKRLNEKNKLLAQILREENALIKSGSEKSKPPTSIAVSEPLSKANSPNIQSIRRKVIGTSFIYPDNLLNNYDDINKLQLDRKIQQQISDASLKLSSDLTQTKSIRRAHKSNFDNAQEKIRQIDKTLENLQDVKVNVCGGSADIDESNKNKILRANSLKHPMPSTLPSTSASAAAHSRLVRHNSNFQHEPLQLQHSHYTLNYPVSPIKVASSVASNVDDMTAATMSYEYLVQQPQYYNRTLITESTTTIANGGGVDQTNQYPQVQMGLGGYWIPAENNERVWCTLDSRYSSLDRKNYQYPVLNKNSYAATQPTKSTSLGNFDQFLSKHDEMSDTVSISSMSSETKKQKEKTWCETSVDSPVMMPKHQHTLPTKMPAHQKLGSAAVITKRYSPVQFEKPSTSHDHQSHNHHLRSSPLLSSPKSQHPPLQQQQQPTVYRDNKPKLSSHSMSLPHRNNLHVTTTQNQLSVAQHLKVSNPNNNYYDIANVYPQTCYYQQPTSNQKMHSPQHQHHHQQQLPPIPSHFQNNNNNPSPSQLSPIYHHPIINKNVENQNQISSQPPQNQNQQQQQQQNPIDIRIESPKNMTVVQQAKFRPYKEVSKPFEMSDFYKYSTKFRQKNNQSVLGERIVGGNSGGGSGVTLANNNDDVTSSSGQNSENVQPVQKVYYQPPNPSICQPINYQ